MSEEIISECLEQGHLLNKGVDLICAQNVDINTIDRWKKHCLSSKKNLKRISSSREAKYFTCNGTNYMPYY